MSTRRRGERGIRDARFRGCAEPGLVRAVGRGAEEVGLSVGASMVGRGYAGTFHSMCLQWTACSLNMVVFP